MKHLHTCIVKMRKFVDQNSTSSNTLPAKSSGSKSSSSSSSSRGGVRTGKKSSAPIPSSSSSLLSDRSQSDDEIRTYQRLVSLLTILENLTLHSVDDFAFVSSVVSRGIDESLPPTSGAQLLFHVIELFAHNIDAHRESGSIVPDEDDHTSEDKRSNNPTPTQLASMPSSSSTLILPSFTTTQSLTPLLIVLRLWVNVTNRNDEGVKAINRMYSSRYHQGEVSGTFQLLPPIPPLDADFLLKQGTYHV